MNLTFKDFRPEIQKKILGIPTDYESIHEVLTRVKRWIERERIRIINVETLLLPALPNGQDDTTPAKMTAASSSMGTYQVIRVWYDDTPTTAETGITRRLNEIEQPGAA